MQVLAVSNSYIPMLNTGAQRTLHELLKPIRQLGNDVTVLLTTPRGGSAKYELDGIRIQQCCSFLELEISARKADVIVTHLSAVPTVVGLARTCGRPLVQLVHGNDSKSRHRAKLGADFLVLCAQWLAKSFSDLEIPYMVVHPPVDSELYETIPGNKVTLVNLSLLKGVDVFYQLVTQLPDINFLGVIGGHERQIIKVFPNLEIAETTSHMKEHVYARTRIILMPSRVESFGRVAVEAAQSGIPTIAAPTPGLREALGDAGVFVDLHETDRWASALHYLMIPEIYSAYRAASMSRARMLETQTQRELGQWIDLLIDLASKTDQIR